MKKYLLIFMIFVLIPMMNVKAISTSATSAVLMDQDSGRILYSENIHEVRSIASISKIMTGILAVESGKLDETVTVGDEILKAYGSGIYIKQGEKISLRDLVYGLMLRSGNDAAVTIATYVSGSVEEFVSLMNAKATELGMKHTTFNNPSGLDEEEGNYSCAYDMAILTSYAMKNKDYRTITGTKKHTVKTNKNTYVWHNKHKLLTQYKYATGGKTGFTKKARRTLVTTATNNDMNLVVVTLNDGDDFNDHMNLFEYGFQNYENQTLLKKGNLSIKNEKYYKNQQLYIKNDVIYPVEKEEEDSLKIKYSLSKKRGNEEVVGQVKVYLGSEEVIREPIYVKEKEKKSSEKKGWFHLW